MCGSWQAACGDALKDAAAGGGSAPAAGVSGATVVAGTPARVRRERASRITSRQSFLSAWWVSPVPMPVIGPAPAVVAGRVASAGPATANGAVGA
jgi:hypothetical protein